MKQLGEGAAATCKLLCLDSCAQVTEAGQRRQRSCLRRRSVCQGAACGFHDAALSGFYDAALSITTQLRMWKGAAGSALQHLWV